jgi:hypothetical protein
MKRLPALSGRGKERIARSYPFKFCTKPALRKRKILRKNSLRSQSMIDDDVDYIIDDHHHDHDILIFIIQSLIGVQAKGYNL